MSTIGQKLPLIGSQLNNRFGVGRWFFYLGHHAYCTLEQVTLMNSIDRMNLERLVRVALFLLGIVALVGCERAKLDEELRRLCAVDGGVRVYETVKLPISEFNEYGQVSFYKSLPGSELLSFYTLIREEHTYKSGNPRMWRTYTAVRRVRDGKILGESIGYTRFGDGFEGPFHPSSISCPEAFGEVPLLGAVFFPAK